jgi:hypothetical protein
VLARSWPHVELTPTRRRRNQNHCGDGAERRRSVGLISNKRVLKKRVTPALSADDDAWPRRQPVRIIKPPGAASRRARPHADFRSASTE